MHTMTLIEALTDFTVSLSFVDRQIDKSKDQAPKKLFGQVK